MKEGHYLTQNLDTYLIPTVADAHRSFELEAIDDLPEGDRFGPRGIGEVGSVALAPAIASAVYNAVGIRPSKLPISAEELQSAFAVPEGGSPR
jgi:CO/xanthine dehydrogenase Mo-binding subunit